MELFTAEEIKTNIKLVSMELFPLRASNAQFTDLRKILYFRGFDILYSNFYELMTGIFLPKSLDANENVQDMEMMAENFQDEFSRLQASIPDMPVDELTDKFLAPLYLVIVKARNHLDVHEGKIDEPLSDVERMNYFISTLTNHGIFRREFFFSDTLGVRGKCSFDKRCMDTYTPWMLSILCKLNFVIFDIKSADSENFTGDLLLNLREEEVNVRTPFLVAADESNPYLFVLRYENVVTRYKVLYDKRGNVIRKHEDIREFLEDLSLNSGANMLTMNSIYSQIQGVINGSFDFDFVRECLDPASTLGIGPMLLSTNDPEKIKSWTSMMLVMSAKEKCMNRPDLTGSKDLVHYLTRLFRLLLNSMESLKDRI